MQSAVPVNPGTIVHVGLNASAEFEAIALRASVVWRRVVPARLRGIARGGMGLRIHGASEEYYRLLARITRVDPVPPQPSSSEESADPKPDPRRPPESAEGRARPFRVRLAQPGGPRSRTITVSGATAEEARARALAEAGEGWIVQEVERR